MLRELWTKLRGTDKWPEAQATVRIVEQYEEPSAGRYESDRKLANVTFAYTDNQGSLQYGSITVQDSSDLYDAKENDTFSIRVDPMHPERYYSFEPTKADV
jgi:hypothetical protein